MAKPTSSRNRSTRRALRRPTSSATRGSRSASSTNSSRVTTSGQTGMTGARVTSSTRPTTPPTGTGPSSPQRTGQDGGRTIRGYIKHRNGYYYKPGKPNIFYKKEGNTFKPVSQGTLRIKPGQAQTNTAVKRPTGPTKPNVASVADNLKFLRDAFARQQAKGMAAQTVPGVGQLISALLTGASVGEAYRQTDRAPAVSSRGEGRSTFNQGPIKRNYPVQVGKVDETKQTPAQNTGQRNLVSGGSVPKAPPVRDSLKVRIEKEYDVLRDEFNNNEIGAVEFKSEAEKLFNRARVGGLHGSSRKSL
jgi:hypothetical protein